jgi:predicted nucleotidyltransferase
MRKQGFLPNDVQKRLAGLGEIVGRHPSVRFAYLFGGAAAGVLTPLSDVDVAVFLDPSADPIETRWDLLGVVMEHLETEEVDLVILNRAPLSLAGRIVLGRRVICDRDPWLRHRFESLTLRKFFDFRRKEEVLLKRRFAVG